MAYGRAGMGMIVYKENYWRQLDGSDGNCIKEINQLLTSLGRVSSSLLSIPIQLLVTGCTVLYTTLYKT